MRVLLISLFLTLLDTTQATKGSSVDLALETVLEFNEAVDAGVIDKIKGIVDDIRNNFKENPQDGVPDEKKEPYNFTDFLRDAIIATNSYNDDELVQILDIIHSEIDEMDLKDVDYIRGYIKNNIADMKRDSRKARKNLDNLLNNLRNTNGNRNDNFYLNFINSLYKRNSEQKFLNILNRLNVFRRRGVRVEFGNELRMVIRTALQDLISELNITGDKRRILEMLLDEYNRNLNDRIMSEIADDDAKTRLPIYKQKLKDKTVHKKRQRTHSKYFNERPRHTKENRVKLTHVTLYPENIEVIEKRKFIADTNKKVRNEFHGDVSTDRNEIETQERIGSSSEVNSNSENDSDTQDRSNEITDDVKSNTRYRRTTRWTKLGTFRSKVVRTRKITKKNYDSTAEKSSRSASGSFEQFGSLNKYTKAINKNKKIVHKSNLKIRKNSSSHKIFETDKIRRANYPETSNNEIKKTTLTEPVTNTQLNKNINDILKNISKIHNSRRNMVLTSNTLITKPINNVSVTSLNITKKFLLTTQITKPTKVIKNTKKETKTTITQTTTEIANVTLFDVNSFIKNSEVQTIENAEKKKLLEKKMKEDLDALFSMTTTTTTTEVYADIFKGMEDEFNVS
ncbi:uncharacterized protein LOC124542075 [Vanessa cardui]|uniref:uncharacterized protein LOC124542075 n=1 Tax=Vanessa cardui TaxID=171605 RepID=UPI001F146436|nr:uncharacterized protein LOC124542075 [Vanessa cardui]